MGTVFKDGADDFLRGLRAKFDVCIVTNSGTSGVTKKIIKLLIAYHLHNHCPFAAV